MSGVVDNEDVGVIKKQKEKLQFESGEFREWDKRIVLSQD